MTSPTLPQIVEDPSMWLSIESAPKDGTAIQARIPGHGDDNVIAWHWGLVDEDENDCGSWTFVSDQEPPDDWMDGWCWASNADEVRSTWPTHWKPLPASPEQVRTHLLSLGEGM